MADRAPQRQDCLKYFDFPDHSFNPLVTQQSPESIIHSWYSKSINGRSGNGLGSTSAQKINKDNIICGQDVDSLNDCLEYTLLGTKQKEQ
jgi:hypothetical protein